MEWQLHLFVGTRIHFKMLLGITLCWSSKVAVGGSQPHIVGDDNLHLPRIPRKIANIRYDFPGVEQCVARGRINHFQKWAF